MSEILKVIQAHRDEIIHILVEKINRAQCRALLKTRAGDSVFLLDTLMTCCQDASDVPISTWVAAMRAESGSPLPPSQEVHNGLSCLVRSVRLIAVKHIHHKKTLLTALSELTSAVDRLRHGFVDSAETSSGSEVRSFNSFQAVAEGSNDFICLATSHGEPYYINPAGRRMLGLADGQQISTTRLHDYYTPESWTQLRDIAVPAVNKTGKWQGTCHLRNMQNGGSTEVQTIMLRVKSPEGHRPTTLVIIHREMGDRNNLEQMLSEAEARKHAILESSLDPIITINHEGIITEFNRAAEQTFGYSRDKIIGTKPSDVLFSSSMGVAEQEQIQRYLIAGEGSKLGKRVEVTAVKANGESFPAEMAMTISQEQGAPVMSFFFRDISARKKAETEQTRYAAELERSNNELEQFAYMASHDLQEPLRKIRTFSDRLLLKQAEMLDEDGRESLERMHNAAARMQSLIDGLLALSRVTTKGQNLVTVDLAQVANEVVSDLEV
ncbi:MAG TPA: PAS domain S-box protein, partial [Thermoguttaceae bacterium]